MNFHEDQPSTSGPPIALIVDDDPQVLPLLVRCLRTEGFQTLAAHSVIEAHQMAEQASTIDVLVADIFLGDGWGGDLAFQLQQVHPRMAVVFVSGQAGADPILRHGIQEHMTFLEKPFTLAELAVAVGKAMEGRASP